MELNKKTITVTTTVQKTINQVWDCWTNPEHITHWNFATDEWHCPTAINELEPKGRFVWRMEAKDGSMGFDYAGTYEKIILHKEILAELEDGRKVVITFSPQDNQTILTETFEVEDTNNLELQRKGWQSILDNFKKYAEENS